MSDILDKYKDDNVFDVVSFKSDFQEIKHINPALAELLQASALEDDFYLNATKKDTNMLDDKLDNFFSYRRKKGFEWYEISPIITLRFSKLWSEERKESEDVELKGEYLEPGSTYFRDWFNLSLSFWSDWPADLEKKIPWELIIPLEKGLMSRHEQSLFKLHRRWWISPFEFVCAWRECFDTLSPYDWTKNLIQSIFKKYDWSDPRAIKILADLIRELRSR